MFGYFKVTMTMSIEKLWKNLPKLNPAGYAYIISKGKWKPARHLMHLNQQLLHLANRKIKRLIVNMPPRHGKSELISKYFPAWFLSNFPDKRIILTSYSSNFARNFGQKVRDLILEFGEDCFNIKLNPKHRSAESFSIDGHLGGMETAGAGGSITGKAADLLIIDDPIKNDIQANSRYMREKIWDWFNATAFTRLEPNGIVVLVMTRWHQDDLAGRILKSNDKASWHHLNLTALADENDVIGRKPGEPLWKERYSAADLDNIKSNVGSYWFSALYQQRPVPRGTSIFKKKNFKYYYEENGIYHLKQKLGVAMDEIKFGVNLCRRFAVVDLAATLKETSDYTVILIFSITASGDFLVEEVFRERFQGSEHLELIKDINEKFKPLLIGIESNQYQISLVQSGLAAGLPVKELRADRDKISRALPISAKIEAGMVYFKENAHWLSEFEEELLGFPNAKHDDQVDALAYTVKIAEPVSGIMPTSRAKVSKPRGISKNFG
jgi:predicted phage terminase large subunit-like protein